MEGMLIAVVAVLIVAVLGGGSGIVGRAWRWLSGYSTQEKQDKE